MCDYRNQDSTYQSLFFDQSKKNIYKFPCVVVDPNAVNNLVANSFGFNVTNKWNDTNEW